MIVLPLPIEARPWVLPALWFALFIYVRRRYQKAKTPEELTKKAMEVAEAEAKKSDELASLRPVKFVSPLSDSDRHAKWFDLHTMEYAKAAERYDNVYKAIWLNFSYMSVLAAGIVSFGASRLPMPVVILLALTPLMFWVFATFLPMNYYGDELRKRLATIERNLNEVYYSDAPHLGLAAFTRYKSLRWKWRVSDAVNVFGALVVFGWIGASVYTTDHYFGRALWQQDRPAAITPLSDFVRLRMERDSVRVALQDSLQRLNGVLDSLKATAPPRPPGVKGKGKPAGRKG